METRSSKKLGLLIIGRKRPGFDQEWNQIMQRRALEALEALSFECVGADTRVVDDQTTIAALAKLKQSDCQALLVLQPSLGNGQLSLTVAQHWEAPLVLWATPERAESEKVSSCSLVAQHLWGSVMRQVKHPFELVLGDPADESVRKQVGRAIAVCSAAASLRNTKVGLIGSHAPGFIAMEADPFVLRQSLGAQLHRLSLVQFIERVRAIGESDVSRDVERVRAMKLPMVNVTGDDLATNSRYYLAMKELMAEESLDALAVQCWPELPNVCGQWPYLAMSRLTEEGIAISMEGDVDGALTCLIALRLGAGVGFITDWLEHDEKTIGFWHAGNAPPSLCNPIGSARGPSLGLHFNINKPLVVDGSLRSDMAVTVARLWRCDGRYHLTAFEGRTIAPRRNITGNTAWVQVLDGDMRDRFDTLLHAGLPHHVVLFAGNHAEPLRRFARTASIDWL